MPEQGILYNLLPNEVSPPQDVWNRINASLGEDAVKATFGQIAEWEQEPPLRVWNNVESILNTAGVASEIIPAVAINNMEVVPPASEWNHVHQQLELNKIKKLEPGKSDGKKIWQIAAAAAFIGIIVFVSPLLKGHKQGNKMASNITNIVDPSLAEDTIHNTVPKEWNIIVDSTITFPGATTQFVKAVGPNGNSVKVSPKLTPMIAFFDDIKTIETRTNDKAISVKSKMWKQKLIDWKTKINNPVSSAAAINFADPIDLIRFLQKKK